MKYTVYLRTNTVNGKQYVGQTDNLKRREQHWKSLSFVYGNKKFSEERNKYGLENFSLEILAIVDTREEAWALEQTYIKELNTKYPNGYNICDGGGGALGYKHTDDSKKKIADNNARYWLGRHRSEETKEIISRKSKERLKDPTNHPMYGKRGEDSPRYGKHLSEETKKKIGEANKISLKGKHLSDETKKKISEKNKISMKGKKPSEATMKAFIEKCTKPVIQTKDGKFIAEYQSASEAQRVTGIFSSNISFSCNHKNRKAGGFDWYFKKDYEQKMLEDLASQQLN